MCVIPSVVGHIGMFILLILFIGLNGDTIHAKLLAMLEVLDHADVLAGVSRAGVEHSWQSVLMMHDICNISNLMPHVWIAHWSWLCIEPITLYGGAVWVGLVRQTWHTCATGLVGLMC